MKRFKYLTLAALVVFAACDEGEDAPPTGTISGAVTIEGTGASGVTVSLSSGATTTTDGSGQYTFADVEAGSYTVTISGYPADATFSTTSQAAAITSAGQVVTVNFAGTYVRTAAILGNVSAGGPLAGVTVSIGGGQTTQTDANGQYAFSGLRAGTYTVTISGFDTNLYVFTETSKSVTVATGESQVVSFSGMLATTAVIRGTLFVDENVKNNTFDSTEEPLAAAGVLLTLELSPGNTITTETAADGTYEFADLEAGTYGVTIDDADTDIPANYALGGPASVLVTVTVGATGTANFPFDIVVQTMRVGAFLGRDAGTAMVAPVEGVDIELYPSEVDLNGGTNILGTETTGADGYAVFDFDRADDTAPGGGTDHIVYAKWVNTTPTGIGTLYSQNGETQMEISYPATQAVATGPDVFDFLYNQLVVKTHVAEIDADTLAGWNVVMRVNKDSTFATTTTDVSDADGDSYFAVTPGLVDALPDTIWMRLSTTQPATHGWTQTPVANEGTGAGRYLMYVWDGTVLPSDTVDLGVEEVAYTHADVTVRAHHERDDSTDVATFTLGDDFASIAAIEIELFELEADGDTVSVAAASTPDGSGLLTFIDLDVTKSYMVEATSIDANVVVLDNTKVDLAALDGSDEFATDETLTGGAGKSTFAYKTTNNTLFGNVYSRMGASGAVGLVVTATPTADNIQGSEAAVDTTTAAGAYTIADLREGPYSITVTEGDSAWTFLRTLEVASLPTSGPEDNASATEGVRDLQGYGISVRTNFEAYRTDVKISGVVVNDRDGDGNTIDPNEALAGAVVELYMDDAGAAGLDSLVTSATTDANGAYSFTDLREGRYVIKYQADTPDNTVTVLRALSKDTAVATPLAGANVGSTSPVPLPGWDYTNTVGTNLGSSNFAFLYKNTTVSGTITDGTNPVEGMTVSMRRCNISPNNPPATPPAAGQCTSYLGTTVNTTTNASGQFSFTDLVEGVYEITPQPSTVGGFNTSAPAHLLYWTSGTGDVETGSFVVS